jgi:hypothetical protein
VLRDSLRPADIPCRYGGEEFVVVLPGCGIPEAVQVLERVMRRTADRLSVGNHPNFTVSFGVASSEQASGFHAVVTLADEALLLAKSAGRNKIIVAGRIGSDRSDKTGNPTPSSEPSSAAIDELVEDISALSPAHSGMQGEVISEQYDGGSRPLRPLQ